MEEVSLVGPHLIFARAQDFPAFRARVTEVYARAKSIPLAAKELEVGERTLKRWLKLHPELRGAWTGRDVDKNGRAKRT